MNDPHQPPSKFWPACGMIAGALLVSVPMLVFMVMMMKVQRGMNSGGIADPREVMVQANIMAAASVGACVLVPIGALVFIFSTIRYAKLRRATPPRLPRTPPAGPANEPS